MAQVSGPDRSRAPGLHRRDLGQDEHGSLARLGTARQAPGRACPAWSLADADIPRGLACRCHYRTLPVRRTDQRRELPALRRAVPGADSHKAAAIRQALRAAGARLIYLPPYSPDLNPIEQAFSKLKHWLRTARERSIDEACQRIASILETFSPEECRNYFVNAGYRPV